MYSEIACIKDDDQQTFFDVPSIRTMAPVRNARVIFVEIPNGLPDPQRSVKYDESETIDLDNVPLNGGFLAQAVAFSIDPYMRSRMREPHIVQRFTPFLIGEPLVNYGVGRVIRSENPAIKSGDYFHRRDLSFQEFSVVPDMNDVHILTNEEKLPWTVYCGTTGMAGQTAWMGWKEYASPKKGDVCFVTAAGGPVGSFVIQLAKAAGCKVIASAGSDDKLQFAKECGADVVFNYKTTNTSEMLQKEGPINIYWDNVGGESLDAALANSALEARFIECGMISNNNGRCPHVKNLGMIVAHDLKVFGFIVGTLLPKYEDAFYREVPPLIKDGKIKYREDVKKGLQHVGQAIYEVQTGGNKGKSVISLE